MKEHSQSSLSMGTVFSLIITGRTATPDKLIQDIEVNGERIHTTHTIVEQDIVTALAGKCLVEFECERLPIYDKVLFSIKGDDLVWAKWTNDRWIIKCKATIKVK